MFAYIKGRLTEKSPTHVVIDAGGVGYHINISLNTYSKLGSDENIRIFTHLIVREDAQILYGFADEQERELFRHLISVSGVGANTARLILSSLTGQELTDAIITGNISVLQSVKGIGGKTAQRIVIDLKDKLGKAVAGSEKLESTHNTKKEEALSGLIILGFNKNVAGKAIDKVLKEYGASISVEEIIKKALKLL
ncbi:MAG: Holliday junction branch migration protein RuvA [Bacteroidales bacterium]|nr:Holliday junction branch migration protein RuvA [Bacteroidales bacterium]MCF8388939.1 Holliday junction branch migration protein RuvA [Bacteroidales bacterium]MCF8397234.1 Holliday junction branch migration protein RuvA [Bacteroidales bacterium]